MLGLGDPFHGGGGIGGGSGAALPCLELLLKDLAVGGIVIDDEGVMMEEGRQLGGRLGSLGGIDLEADGKPESGALTGLGLEADVAAHEFGELFGDGEAEAGAAELSGSGIVGLSEVIEEIGLVLFRDAHPGIANGEAEEEGGFASFGLFDGEDDLAGFGEFEGIAEEVGEDLAESSGVAEEAIREIGLWGDDEFEVFMSSLGGEHPADLVEEGAEAERGILEFDAAGLNFGEVEDIIDEAEEGFGGQFGGFGEVALGGLEVGIKEQAGHPEDAVEGRTDFVAHFGKEFGLGLIGGLGFLFGLLEGDLEIFALGDVLKGTGYNRTLTFGIKSGFADDSDPAEVASGGVDAQFVVEAGTLCDGVLKGLFYGIAVVSFPVKVQGGRNIGIVIARDLVDPAGDIGPDEAARFWEILPCADLGDAVGAGEEIGDFPEFELKPLLFGDIDMATDHAEGAPVVGP